MTMLSTLLPALITSFVATLGFGVLLHAPKRALLHAALIGAAGYGCAFALQEAGLSGQAALFAGALGASLLAEWAARRMKMAATVFITLSIIPLVPGLALYRAMAFMAQGATDAGLETGVEAMMHILMIALGVGMGSFLFRLKKPHSKKS